MSDAPHEVERRVLHASTALAGLLLLTPALTGLTTVALSLLAAVAAALDLARRRARPLAALVRAAASRWLRPAEEGGMTGSTLLLVSYAITALMWPGPVAGRAVSVAALADPAAAAAGRALGGPGGGKTLTGTAAAFVTAALTLLALQPADGAVPYSAIPVAAAVAAVAERAPWPGADNVLMAPLTAACLGLFI